MTRRSAFTAVTLACLIGEAACRRPAPPPPVPVAAPNTDSIAAANARRAEAARRDSIARADAARLAAARRDSIARAEAARRAEAAAAEARATLTRPVYFDFEADSVRADAVVALDAKVPLLRNEPNVRIRIEGHADDRGSDEYNLALGQRRAAAARRYLAARGIAESRIDVTSFGEQRPTCRDETESCWQANRRDEFVITSGGVQPRPE